MVKYSLLLALLGPLLLIAKVLPLVEINQDLAQILAMALGFRQNAQDLMQLVTLRKGSGWIVAI